MTAQEIKNEYQIYPEVKVRIKKQDDEDVFETITATRKKYNGSWYLERHKSTDATESVSVNMLKTNTDLYLKHSEYIHPNSPAGIACPFVQVLDDNQNG